MSTATALTAIVTEEQLIQQLVARDEQALRTLYERYGTQLLITLRRVVRDEEMARDVLQEGLLKIWNGIGSYDAGRGRLYTWMVRLCSNHAVDALRNPRQRMYYGSQSLDNTEAQWRPASVTFHPEHIGLRELTLQLKPRQREIITLLYFGGFTQVETAEQLGIPLATVKTRARAALVVLGRLVR
jgi:RNA polymerase sigma-70 factor (ECF subfamily)